jgi:hypothetical protein
MFNKLAIQSLVASAVFGLALAFSAGPVGAGPPPVKKDVCHNIGGPNGLGANCDGTAECELITNAFLLAQLACLQFSTCNTADIYAGIVVPFSDAAIDAHIKHGDGFALATFLRIHDTQPHISANVDCFAVRPFPDPGN